MRPTLRQHRARIFPLSQGFHVLSARRQNPPGPRQAARRVCHAWPPLTNIPHGNIKSGEWERIQRELASTEPSDLSAKRNLSASVHVLAERSGRKPRKLVKRSKTVWAQAKDLLCLQDLERKGTAPSDRCAIGCSRALASQAPSSHRPIGPVAIRIARANFFLTSFIRRGKSAVESFAARDLQDVPSKVVLSTYCGPEKTQRKQDLIEVVPGHIRSPAR